MSKRAVAAARLIAAVVILAGMCAWGVSALAQDDGSAPPHTVIAQGLAIAPEPPAIWRVRSVDPLAADEAESTTLDFSFAYGLTGGTVIRNDVTFKRARIEPGEAYFFSGGDPYTWYRYGNDPTTVLMIEFAPATDEEQPEGVLYASEPIDSFPSNVLDYELYHGQLGARGETTIRNYLGPALLFILEGSAIVTPTDGEAVGLEANGGLILDVGAQMTAGNEGVTYLIAGFQDQVLDPDELAAQEEAAGTPEPAGTPEAAEGTPAASPAADATPDAPLAPSADEDRDGLLNGDEPREGTDPRNPDTDGDGLTDGEEVQRHETDPLNADTDGDGLNDGYEINTTQTDPLEADTDSDGASDGDEWFIYGTDPTDEEDAP